MRNIPVSLREALEGTFLLRSAVSVKTCGKHGATQKLLIRLRDGEVIETVVIPARSRLTVCLSSQVGCKFKCDFCGKDSNIITRIALDEGYDRLVQPHLTKYACPPCSEEKEQARTGGVERPPKICPLAK